MKIKRDRPLLKYWVPVYLWAIFIFIMSSIPGDDLAPLFPYQDVFYHLGVYFIFGCFLSRAMKHSYLEMNRLKQIAFAVLAGVIYALGDEFHQSFVSQRLASWGDWSLDSAGIIFGSLIYQWQR